MTFEVLLCICLARYFFCDLSYFNSKQIFQDNLDDSETGSESGFQTAPTDPVENRGTSHVTTLVYDSEEDKYNSDDSVDLLQPTQVKIASAITHTGKNRICNIPHS